MKLIVGLGNPGEKYVNIRHNLGFMVVDEYVSSVKGQGSWKMDKKLKADICCLQLETHNLLLAKPQAYMNNSGMVVKLLADYYKIAPEDIIVIHDELDLPLGKIKTRLGGAAAGHHGVESIISALGTDQFIRIRLGISNLRTQSAEHKGQTVGAEKFVLKPFMPKEKTLVKHMIRQAVKALDLFLKKGLKDVQNQYN